MAQGEPKRLQYITTRSHSSIVNEGSGVLSIMKPFFTLLASSNSGARNRRILRERKLPLVRSQQLLGLLDGTTAVPENIVLRFLVKSRTMDLSMVQSAYK